MRRAWLGFLGRADADKAHETLDELAAAGNWPEIAEQAGEMLRALPDDPKVLTFAARAALETADETTASAAGGQAEPWLTRAASHGEPSAEILYLRGWAAYCAGDAQKAAEFWQQTLKKDPRRTDARDGLINAWIALKTLPDWGVSVVEAALTNSDR